jgi:hypothetical protein
MPGTDRRRLQQLSLFGSFVTSPEKLSAGHPPILHVEKKRGDTRSPGKGVRNRRRERNVYTKKGDTKRKGCLSTPTKRIKGSEYSPLAFEKGSSYLSLLIRLSARGRTLSYFGESKRTIYDTPPGESDWSKIKSFHRPKASRTLTDEDHQIDTANITLDLIRSIDGRQENRQEEVMRGMAVHHLLHRSFHFKTDTGEILATKEALDKHKIILVWAHIIADRIGGKNKKRNLMVGSDACNLAERMITNGLLAAITNHASLHGDEATGHWELTVTTYKAEANSTPGPIQQYWTNIASKQIYSYTYIDPTGDRYEPLEFTLCPLDPNPLSFRDMKVNLQSIFADVMSGQPLFDDSQALLTEHVGRSLFSSDESSSAGSSTDTDDPEEFAMPLGGGAPAP